MATIRLTSVNDDILASEVNAQEDDVILGLEGDDIIEADVANITVDGGDGSDTLVASADNVTLYGGAGEIDVLQSNFGVDGTTMEGGAGDDELLGFGTNDTASYANDPAGVTVDLSARVATDGYGGTDLLIEIENVTGSAFNDILIGDNNSNVLQGGAGNDTLTGNGGADVFKYSFTLTPGGGGGETFSFTDFFTAHGGSVVDGEVADGTGQGQFSSLYTQWLESLGLTVLDLGQNAGPDGMPVVEGPAGTFGERESFTWTSGGGKKTVTHERWYSDTWTSDSGGGQDSVASGDGFDTILDFTWGEDKLEFSGLAGMTLDQFTSLFSVTETDVDGIGGTDTVLALADDSWSVTLLGVSGHGEQDFYDTSLFS
ncbi:MAG TPA: calcium-binding protein [Candidatus Methylomirabilis sp.]|nr:calcium-binding protein [Candidatus Methylomirabilis sp.]